MENNKQEISFENLYSLHLYAQKENEFVDDNVNSFSNKENEGIFYFENSNNEINEYYNVIENENLNIKTVNKNYLFKKIFNDVFKPTKNNEFDYSIEEELYIISEKKKLYLKLIIIKMKNFYKRKKIKQ